MRVSAHARAVQAQKEAARKAKFSKGFTEDDDAEANKESDIMKKNSMTTDHMGKAIPCNTIKTDNLPKMAPASTKSVISLRKEVTVKEDSKRQ